VLAQVALVALVAMLVLGLTLLTGLLCSRRRLEPVVLMHLVTALVSVASWTAYVASDEPRWLAWAVLLLLMLTNTFGDTMMVRGWRARAVRGGRPARTGAGAYVAAAVELLSFSRPIAALHGVLAGVSFFSVLLVALGVGD
jgi:hypothetical protein